MNTLQIINSILLNEEGLLVLPSGKTECSLGYGWTEKGHRSLLEDLLDTKEDERIIPDEGGYKVETPYTSSCLLPTVNAARDWLAVWDEHGQTLEFDPLEVNIQVLRKHSPAMGKVYSRMKKACASHWDCREALLKMLPPQEVFKNRIRLIA